MYLSRSLALSQSIHSLPIIPKCICRSTFILTATFERLASSVQPETRSECMLLGNDRGTTCRLHRLHSTHMLSTVMDCSARLSAFEVWCIDGCRVPRVPSPGPASSHFSSACPLAIIVHIYRTTNFPPSAGRFGLRLLSIADPDALLDTSRPKSYVKPSFKCPILQLTGFVSNLPYGYACITTFP